MEVNEEGSISSRDPTYLGRKRQFQGGKKTDLYNIGEAGTLIWIE